MHWLPWLPSQYHPWRRSRLGDHMLCSLQRKQRREPVPEKGNSIVSKSWDGSTLTLNKIHLVDYRNNAGPVSLSKYPDIFARNCDPASCRLYHKRKDRLEYMEVLILVFSMFSSSGDLRDLSNLKFEWQAHHPTFINYSFAFQR